MIPVDLVTEGNRPVAALCPQALTPQQRDILYSLLPPESYRHPGLAGRWELADVLAPRGWADQQARRTPMLKPHCVRISFP
jgi:hypothetical protein